MAKIYIDVRAVSIFNTTFTVALVWGGEGVVLERDIDLHMDAEGEIVGKQVRSET